MKTLYISRKLKRDHRTLKRFVADSEYRRVHADKGRMRKVSARQIHRIKKAAAKMPLQSSKQVFEVGLGDMAENCITISVFHIGRYR